MNELQIMQGPVEVIAFGNREVPVYEADGDYYLTGEDLGEILGLADPRNGARLIYRRNQAELEMYSRAVKLIARDGRPRQTRLYDEVGAHLIAMFAKTPRAREVRKWLAALPKQVRRVQARQAAVLPEILEEIKKQATEEVANRLMSLLATPTAGRLGLKKMSRMLQLRSQGLTQTEVGKLYDVSKPIVAHIEREMCFLFGIKIERVNGMKRQKEMLRGFAQMLSGSMVTATLRKPGGQVVH